MPSSRVGEALRNPPPVPFFVLLTVVVLTGETRAAAQTAAQEQQPALASYGNLPLHFEANQGQTAEQVKFLARGSGYTLFLTSTESVLVLRSPEVGGPGNRVTPGKAVTSKRSTPSAVLRMKLLGANPRPAVEGREELPGKSHYFIGADRKRWRTNVPQYARVEYREVYPGVSLTYYGNQGQLEYDFVVGPGADLGSIRFGIEGADAIRVDGEGNLRMRLEDGEVIQRAPVVYQEVDGERKAIDGRFVLRPGGEMGFEVGRYDVNRPLVLDPVLMYSTYLGGSGWDVGYGIAVDASRSAYVTGTTASIDFPTANPLQGEKGGSDDVFVSKLNAAGSAFVYSTYIGGSDSEQGSGIAVDESGNAYIIGTTVSLNFPTFNSLQGANAGESDAFVAKLNAAGSALVYSTYVGGSDGEFGNGIAVDSSGSAYLAGYTGSTDFPTVNAFQPEIAGYSDAFVAKLNPAGSAFVYSTYLGGSAAEGLHGLEIAVDASGGAYVAGETASTDFPTFNPIQAANGGGPSDAFVSKLNGTGSALVYSTYLGGSERDLAQGIAVDASGTAYISGTTGSTNFPTFNPFQAANGGEHDAFVTKLNAAGSAFLYSTYLGGSAGDIGSGVAVDASGRAHVTGYTYSTNFPMHVPVQGSKRGPQDAFVAELNAAGSALAFSTYLGGGRDESGHRIAIDMRGSAYVTGATNSTDFPTAGPLQDAYGGGVWDAFVSKVGTPSSTGAQGPLPNRP
jgi:hypothetical protein